MRCLGLLPLVLALACHAGERIARSGSAKAAFQRTNPCPSTGKHRGACPGYVIDHVDPLCNGGADRPDNMQWQSVKDAKVKDRAELQLCRAKRRQPATYVSR